MRSLPSLALLCVACAHPAAPSVPAAAATQPAPNAPPPVAAAPAAPASASLPSAPATGSPCGALNCLAFPSSAAALDHVLASRPRVLAVGETHAQQDGPPVASATRRFAEQLLPRLAGKSKQIVIELLVGNGSCGKSETVTAEKQAPVTEHQAPKNQSEFVVLGKVAKRLGIEPVALTPSCEEFATIASSGEADIARMLQMVRDVSLREISAALDNPESREQIVVSYGGALHNDLAPRPGQEAWSFGPELAQRTGSRYVELDLIVPEFIKDTPSWRALAWYSAYKPDEHGNETLLYNPSPSSYVLIFPRTLGASETPAQGSPVTPAHE